MNGSATIPLIPKCRIIIFETGNILTWSRLKKRPLLPGCGEVLDSIGCLLKSWLTQQDESQLQYSDSLHIQCQKVRAQRLDDRDDLRIYVKLTVWLDAFSPGDVREALDCALGSLSADDCDVVVLGLVGGSGGQASLALADLQPVWAELERLRRDDRVGGLGVADCPVELLEELHAWAEEKPRVCQISEKVACTEAPGLRSFAAANGIQVLTHPDPPDPLPAGRLFELLSKELTQPDGSGWRPVWLARVTASYRQRGVVSSWGFVSKIARQAPV